jgi:glucosylceramidase
MKPTYIKVTLAIVLIAAVTGILVHQNKETEQVAVWLTTPDQIKLLSKEDVLNLSSKVQSAETTIQVDENITYQEMEGFGASLTDSSAWLIDKKLSPKEREKLMKDLFDHQEGIGISYMRLPMGASDFALQNYTYNDLPDGETDPELKKFTIDYDKEYIIPTLKTARKINPDLKIMGSPWSPPAWMKTSNSLIGGKLKEDAYEPYSKYFVRFIEDYEAEGLPIDAITVQNEPHHEPTGYPGMRMEPEEQANFIKNHLGPALKEKKIQTKIIAWDHNWDEYYYPIVVLNDPEANQYISGSAFHGYAGEVINQQYVHEEHPDKDIYFTESSGGEWATDFGGNLKWDVQTLIIGATKNWAKTVLKWNLALDESFGPTNGGCSDCRGFVTINQETGDVAFNVEYYSFGHASKFVLPGAYRVESTGIGNGSILHVAFINPDKSKVLIALNTSDENQLFSVQGKGQSFSYTLPAGAVATFVW